MKRLPRYVPKRRKDDEMLEYLAGRLKTTAAALVEAIESGRPYFVHSLKGGCCSRLVALNEIHDTIDQAYALGARRDGNRDT